MWERLLVAAYARTPERPRRAVVRLVTPGYRVGVLAVLFRPDGRLLLVDQPYLRGWALPGGDLKRGETPAAALSRELREELGLRVDVPAPVQAALRTSDRWVSFVVRIDLPQAVADAVRPCSPELREAAWFAPDALPPVHPDGHDPLRLVGVAV